MAKRHDVLLESVCTLLGKAGGINLQATAVSPPGTFKIRFGIGPITEEHSYWAHFTFDQIKALYEWAACFKEGKDDE